VKFKAGDEVILTKLIPEMEYEELLKIVEPYISRLVKIDHIYRNYYIVILNGEEIAFQDDELEYEAVYNSPLYKALK
jgi:hypothetical protein